MITVNDPKIDLIQCRFVGSGRRFDWANKKSFVFTFRYPSEGGVELK